MVQSLPNPNYIDPNPGTSRQELGSLNPDALIELFEVEYYKYENGVRTNVLDYVRWCNHEQTGENSVYWNNLEFTPWPCTFQGLEQTAQGNLPRPTFEISNYRSVVSAFLNIHKPYNALLARRKIFAKHLDNGSEPQPGWQFEPDFFYINSWDVDLSVIFKLVTPLERLNNEIPKRRLRSF